MSVAPGTPDAAGMTAGPARPLISVSLVTHNGLSWLPGCLFSLGAQQGADYELLVLDNGSTDGTLEWLRANLPAAARQALIESPTNIGYAAGHNANIRRARGRLICLLNQDVELDARYLASAAAAFERDPRIAAVQGRIRRLAAAGRPTDRLDTAGLEMLRDRRVISRWQGRPDDPAQRVAGRVWGADGPAPVYRRRALDDARVSGRAGWEVLDEDFFAYKEDVDLAWRLNRLGWQAWYEPAALAWHGRGAAGQGAASLREIHRANRALPRHVAILSWRNQRLMQLKNESGRELLRDLPWIVAREALSLGHMLLADPHRLAAVPMLFAGVPAALAKRRQLTPRYRRR